MLSAILGVVLPLFSDWKTIVSGVLGLAAVVIIGVGYMHYQGLVDDVRRLSENSAKLETAIEAQRSTVEAQRAAIGEWERHVVELRARMDELREVRRAASEQLRRTDETFSRHDLEDLSVARPAMVERRINAGTARSLELLERATGGSGDVR